MSESEFLTSQRKDHQRVTDPKMFWDGFKVLAECKSYLPKDLRKMQLESNESLQIQSFLVTLKHFNVSFMSPSRNTKWTHQNQKRKNSKNRTQMKEFGKKFSPTWVLVCLQAQVGLYSSDLRSSRTCKSSPSVSLQHHCTFSNQPHCDDFSFRGSEGESRTSPSISMNPNRKFKSWSSWDDHWRLVAKWLHF